MFKYLCISGVCLLGFLFGCSKTRSSIPSAEKPNILLLIADDMGYGDLSCYGGPSSTPHLNRLAEEGILFTDFYAAAPNCSPSRAGLMTGRSPARLGIYNYLPSGHPMHLRDEEVTIAEVLQTQGYQTAHIGKWHLGCLPQDAALNHPQPHDQGFDYSLGTENNAQPSHLNPVNFVRNGLKLEAQQGYSCQILAAEAQSWLEHDYQPENPFFMYVAFHEPHAKVASPPELVEKYRDYPEKDAEYLANIENLDNAAGRIIDYLEEKDLLDNTLVIFSSDNGSYRQASNGKLRAVKSYVYEGGIRVPGIIRWPRLPLKDTVIHEAAGFVDIMPTICDVLQLQPPADKELDGSSILNVLQGKEFVRKKPLYWYFYRTSPEIAMRIDHYMLLGRDVDTLPRAHQFSAPDMEYIKAMDLESYELYDLTEDIGQLENIMDSHAEAAAYTSLINAQLQEIQEEGYAWEQLPEANSNRKVKTDWVPYEHIR
jgi:arylsulfatase A